MNPQAAIRSAVELVPNWYFAEAGPHRRKLTAGGETVEFFSHRGLTTRLSALFERIVADLPALIRQAEGLPELLAVDFIQEHFAVFWLSLAAPAVKWRKLLDYMREMGERTYENERVSCNLVISEGAGAGDVTLPSVQKFFDPLATSLQSYIRVNPDIEFVSYEEIPWQSVGDTARYKFYPEFLQPVASRLRPGEVSVHRTHRGDVIVMTGHSLVAAKRKGRWKLYDVETLKNFIVDAIVKTLNGDQNRDYYVGANLFEVLFDLSFKRHGALLVYDPGRRLVDHVVNRGSLLVDGGAEADDARRMLMPSVVDIAMGRRESVSRKKRLFLELASMDGAVVFTPGQITAFGAMIETHPDAKRESGARGTAARSAYYWGGLPIKISSDGEISIHFTSKGARGVECEAKLEFL